MWSISMVNLTTTCSQTQQQLHYNDTDINDDVMPQDLFDVVLAGPVVGLATSALALWVGLQMTAAAGPEALAGPCVVV